LAWAVADLHNPSTFERLQRRLDVDIKCQWDESLPPSERCGVLLQTTTLVDELTVASNLALAKQKRSPRGQQHEYQKVTDLDDEIAHLLSTVSLTIRDGAKRPHQLSGGQARRASLALALAQRKHAIVLVRTD
jgi:ABC-type sulfate/molybdate transport systems ATPase subunit